MRKALSAIVTVLGLASLGCAHQGITRPEADQRIATCTGAGPSNQRTDGARKATLQRIHNSVLAASVSNSADAELREGLRTIGIALDHFRIVLDMGAEAPPAAVQRVRCGVDGLDGTQTLKEVPTWVLATYTPEIYRLGSIGKLKEASQTLQDLNRIMDAAAKAKQADGASSGTP
jgi:hypothetical protein